MGVPDAVSIAHISKGEAPDNRSHAVALIEVALAFVLTHVCYRSVKNFTPIGAWEGAARTSFSGSVVIVTFTIAVLWLCGRNFRAYGLTFHHWREDLSLGLVCTVSMVALGGLGLVVSGFPLDPTRPPDPHASPPWGPLATAAAFVAAGGVGALAMVASRGRLFRALPAAAGVPLITGLLAVLPVAASILHQSSIWPMILWRFFGAGFGEEIFYRGYIQSRVDQAFGRPYRCLGFEFGTGLFVSSLLFGVVHGLNTVDYFHGRFDFGWRMAIESVLAGVFYGLIRARTGSILAGAIAHGLADVLVCMPQVIKGLP